MTRRFDSSRIALSQEGDQRRLSEKDANRIATNGRANEGRKDTRVQIALVVAVGVLTVACVALAWE
jgi:hypothetical protein